MRDASSTQLTLCSILSKGGEEGRRKRSQEREPTQILREVTEKSDLLVCRRRRVSVRKGRRRYRYPGYTEHERRRQRSVRRGSGSWRESFSALLQFPSGAPCGLFGRSA